MNSMQKYEFWLIVGSQHLYGPETLAAVEADARTIAAGLAERSTGADNSSGAGGSALPCRLLFKKVATTSDEILALFREANASPTCAGIVTWMHTFSPSKMWIAGFAANRKPLLHLHTQFNRDIPWATIDMDFMNLNQSAHGDREHGFIQTRMKLARKVVVGHWRNPSVAKRIGAWMRAACAFADGAASPVVRFGDNMRDVAVTEGNKVSAQIQFGWSVPGYGLGELARAVRGVSDAEIGALIAEYRERYIIASDLASDPRRFARVEEQARLELGMRSFLESKGAGAFTTTFEDLEGLPQLPGLASQRLMESGYGFGAEGDWKTAALVRAMKVMGEGLEGGTAFMEDYTYHFEPGNELVMGAHMLEVCPSIARTRPRIEVHPLGIGGKADPARLVFETQTGPAIVATMLDLGDRFRLLANLVESVEAPASTPKLPVAKVLWKPAPSLEESARLWILAGGAHHTSFSSQATQEMLEDYARMVGVECVVIGDGRDPRIVEDRLDREILT